MQKKRYQLTEKHADVRDSLSLEEEEDHSMLSSQVGVPTRDQAMSQYFDSKLRRLNRKLGIFGKKVKKIEQNRRYKLITLLKQYYDEKTIDRFLVSLQDQKSYDEMYEKIKRNVIPHAKLKALKGENDQYVSIDP
jgi:hypothetical protein